MPKKAAKLKPIDPQPGSLTDSIIRLRVGEEHVVVKQLVHGVDDFSEDGLSAIKKKLNNAVSNTVSRIKKATEAEYSVEGAVFSTTRNRLYAAMIVTRDS
jgi:hypothetical protein